MVATQMGITDWRLSQVHNETTGRANKPCFFLWVYKYITLPLGIA